jgi:hypothetical protein
MYHQRPKQKTDIMPTGASTLADEYCLRLSGPPLHQ